MFEWWDALGGPDSAVHRRGCPARDARHDGAHPQRHDSGVRRRHLPRGGREVRAQQGAGRVRDALPLDREPVAGLHPRVLLLLRTRQPFLARARHRNRLRHPDRGQDQRGRRAAPRAGPPVLAARAGRAGHQHRPVPARRGPLPADAGHHRRADAFVHAVLDPHQGHTAASRPAADPRGRRAGPRRTGSVDRSHRRRPAPQPRTRHPLAARPARPGARDPRQRAGVRGDGGPGAPLAHRLTGDPGAPGRRARRRRRERCHRDTPAPAQRRSRVVLRLAAPAPPGPGASLPQACTAGVPMSTRSTATSYANACSRCCAATASRTRRPARSRR